MMQSLQEVKALFARGQRVWVSVVQCPETTLQSLSRDLCVVEISIISMFVIGNNFVLRVHVVF
jgi:hypothetical protein